MIFSLWSLNEFYTSFIHICETEYIDIETSALIMESIRNIRIHLFANVHVRHHNYDNQLEELQNN